MATGHQRGAANERAMARAAAAVEVLPMLEAEAKRRQAAGHYNAPQYAGAPVRQIFDELDDAGKSRDKAADMLNVNPRYVQDAKRIPCPC